MTEKGRKHLSVTPAELVLDPDRGAGVQKPFEQMDSCLRRNDIRRRNDKVRGNDRGGNDKGENDKWSGMTSTGMTRVRMTRQ